MGANLYHRIIRHPQPEDAGTIKITAMVEGYNSTFTTSSVVEEFIDEDHYHECESKRDLNYFLEDSGINEMDSTNGIVDLIIYVGKVTSSASSNYSPECALQVSLFLLHDRQIEEGVRILFASNFVVDSLPRKLYENSSTDEECAICLKEFNNGARIVTLPCEHYFHDECVVKWFETSHVCPLCRFKLPCEFE